MAFYKSWRFWESVLASLVAALLLWLLSQLVRPIGPMVTGMGWEGFSAWFSNLGWFLFVMTLAVWWVNRRPHVIYGGSQPHHQSFSGSAGNHHHLPVVSQEDFPLIHDDDKVAATIPHTNVLPDEPTTDVLIPSYAGLASEIEWKVLSVGAEIVVEVKNVNTSDIPKDGITAWLDDLRKWEEEEKASILTREFLEAEKPGILRLVRGHKSLLFRETQQFGFLSVADSLGYFRVQTYGRDGGFRPIRLIEGPWVARVRVEWDGRSETRTVCFGSQGEKKPPVLVPCPQGAAGTT